MIYSDQILICNQKMLNKLKFLIIAVLLVIINNCGFLMKYKQPKSGFQAKSINGTQYCLYAPSQYFSPNSKVPLMFFLHGAGERGSELEKVKMWGPPKIANEQENFPFMLVAPQCPEEDWWTDERQIENLKKLVNEIISNYKIDQNRVYLTGLSMGGYGTWKLAALMPDTFAAIAPICGGGDPDWGCKLKDIPIWAFHGEEDEVVPVKESREMVEAVKKCGGNKIKLTIYPDVGHGSWKKAYNEENLFEWLLQHKK